MHQLLQKLLHQLLKHIKCQQHQLLIHIQLDNVLGVLKSLASWAGNNWGNAKNWIASAQAAGHSVGTTPVAGAIAVWPNDGGGYGHVAYVTSASGANSIQVMESNYAGNMSIGNYRGTFDPTSSAHGGSVFYIYP